MVFLSNGPASQTHDGAYWLPLARKTHCIRFPFSPPPRFLVSAMMWTNKLTSPGPRLGGSSMPLGAVNTGGSTGSSAVPTHTVPPGEASMSEFYIFFFFFSWNRRTTGPGCHFQGKNRFKDRRTGDKSAAAKIREQSKTFRLHFNTPSIPQNLFSPPRSIHSLFILDPTRPISFPGETVTSGSARHIVAYPECPQTKCSSPLRKRGGPVPSRFKSLMPARHTQWKKF